MLQVIPAQAGIHPNQRLTGCPPSRAFQELPGGGVPFAVGGRRPRLPLDYRGYVPSSWQTGRSAAHNIMGFWKAPLAGITNPVDSRQDEALFQQPVRVMLGTSSEYNHL